MRRFLFAAFATASTITLSQIALAADLPRKAPAPVPAPMVYNWTGWYVGINAGGAWGKSDVSLLASGTQFTAADIAILGANASHGLDFSGFTGGGQIGYNWQFNNSWLFGIETDFNYVGLSETVSNGPFAGAAGFITAISTASVKTDWLFTLRPRLGFTANNWLFYVTGGLAVGNVKFAQSIFFPTTASNNTGSVSDTKAGWTVGGGAEVALAGNWTAKLEYLYVDLGSVDFNTVNSLVGATASMAHSADLRENIVRVGLNYRFGGPYMP